MCQKLTKDKDGDGEIDQWGVANANAFGFTPYVYGNGGQFLNDDQTKVVIDENQNFKDAFQYYTDLTLKYKVTPTVEQDTALGGYQRWLDGQVAFMHVVHGMSQHLWMMQHSHTIGIYVDGR